MKPGEREMEYIRKCVTYADPGADPDSVEILTVGNVFMDDGYRAAFSRTNGLPEQMKEYLGKAVLDVKDEREEAIEVFLDGDFARQRGFADDGTINHFVFVEYEAGGTKKGDLVKLKEPEPME